jgi:hypothetical protein
LSNAELEERCKGAKTLVVDEKVYDEIPKDNYIRGDGPSNLFWESNYEDRDKRKWVVIKSTPLTRRNVLIKIATHLQLNHEVLWKQDGDAYYIHVLVERRYMSAHQISKEVTESAGKVLSAARSAAAQRLLYKHDVLV